jgi:hypothetical protein
MEAKWKWCGRLLRLGANIRVTGMQKGTANRAITISVSEPSLYGVRHGGRESGGVLPECGRVGAQARYSMHTTYLAERYGIICKLSTERCTISR